MSINSAQCFSLFREGLYWVRNSVPLLTGCVLLNKPHNLSEPQAAHLGTVAKIRHGHVSEAPAWHSAWHSPLCPGHSHQKPKSLPYPKQRSRVRRPPQRLLKFCCGHQSFTSTPCPSSPVGVLPLCLREGLTQINTCFHSRKGQAHFQFHSVRGFPWGIGNVFLS